MLISLSSRSITTTGHPQDESERRLSTAGSGAPSQEADVAPTECKTAISAGPVVDRTVSAGRGRDAFLECDLPERKDLTACRKPTVLNPHLGLTASSLLQPPPASGLFQPPSSGLLWSPPTSSNLLQPPPACSLHSCFRVTQQPGACSPTTTHPICACFRVLRAGLQGLRSTLPPSMPLSAAGLRAGFLPQLLPSVGRMNLTTLLPREFSATSCFAAASLSTNRESYLFICLNELWREKERHRNLPSAGLYQKSPQ